MIREDGMPKTRLLLYRDAADPPPPVGNTNCAAVMFVGMISSHQLFVCCDWKGGSIDFSGFPINSEAKSHPNKSWLTFTIRFHVALIHVYRTTKRMAKLMISTTPGSEHQGGSEGLITPDQYFCSLFTSSYIKDECSCL